MHRLAKESAEWADKPGSVVGRPFIFCLRCRRPHSRATRTRAGPTHGAPICPFSGWGLPSRAVADALVRSYRTVSAFLGTEAPGVFFSVALSVGSPRPAVSRHPALWSPDFPHRDAKRLQRGRLAHSASGSLARRPKEEGPRRRHARTSRPFPHAWGPEAPRTRAPDPAGEAPSRMAARTCPTAPSSPR